jgi:hypothetical protein
MRVTPTTQFRTLPSARAGAQAGARTNLLLLMVCLLGVAGGAYWFYRASSHSPADAIVPAHSPLSAATRDALGRLESPLEIRFYSILDPVTVPASVTEFAGRVGRLLSVYQQEADGKIKITGVTSASDLKANAAPNDGIAAFNLDKGEACYLGVVLVLNGRKESLAHLSPEWEQALEPDLTRAIIRLESTARPGPVPAVVSQVNTTALQEVRALIPDISGVSLEAGRQVLQDAAYKEFAAAAKEMQAQAKDAEQRLAEARKTGTEAERQAALQYLQQLQAQQAEKLKEIAARARAQIETFEQIKASAR